MPTCPRCALLAVALAFLAFTGCDTNNPGRDLGLISGVYSVAEITFDPETADLSTADVAARLTSTTNLRIYTNDQARFEVQFAGESGLQVVNLVVSASRGRALFEAEATDDEQLLARLLLPRRFTLEYDEEAPSALEASFVQSGVNLQAFNPTRYQGQTNNRGQLTVRFERQ